MAREPQHDDETRQGEDSRTPSPEVAILSGLVKLDEDIRGKAGHLGGKPGEGLNSVLRDLVRRAGHDV